MNMRKLLALLLTLCLLAGLTAFAEEAAPALQKDLIVLFTSDVHCGVDEPKNLPASVIQSITGRQWILSMF